MRRRCPCAGHDQLERQAEAGELLGLQRLYVCTALSNQPNGGLAEPLKVGFQLSHVRDHGNPPWGLPFGASKFPYSTCCRRDMGLISGLLLLFG